MPTWGDAFHASQRWCNLNAREITGRQNAFNGSDNHSRNDIIWKSLHSDIFQRAHEVSCIFPRKREGLEYQFLDAILIQF